MPKSHASRVFRMPRYKQTLIGICLACAIVGAWVGIHLFAMFAFELALSSLAIALLMALVQCWLSVGLFIVSHDAMHGSLAPNSRRINSLVGASLLFMYAGFAWRRMRDSHFAHHKAPGTNRDPDFDSDNPSSFWMWYATFLRRYFGWPSVFFVGSVVTLYWLVFAVPIENIVLLYGFPAIASSMQLFYFGTYRPHHHSGDEFADGHRARSDEFSWLASLLSCFHFGCHHQHHCSPEVPWWALPSLHRSSEKRSTNA